jgi:tetratricopeptide (TPR) repeat protein
VGVVVTLLIVAASLGAAWAFDAWRFRTEIATIEKEIFAGRYSAANRRLNALPSYWTDRSEALVLRGLSEQGLGRADQALKTWAKVPSKASAAPRAALLSARLLLDRAQFSEAEFLLNLAGARSDRGSTGRDARTALAELLKLEGRFDEAATLYEEADREADPTPVLRDLWSFDHDSFTNAKVRSLLDAAESSAPHDDGVRIARSRLELRAGHLAEAAQYLSGFTAEHWFRNPREKIAAWRTRLDLALATNDQPAIRDALLHLDRADFKTGELWWLRARIAANHGDENAERKALEELVSQKPTDAPALDRLAELAMRAGDSKRGADLRHRKSKLDDAQIRYRDLLFFRDPSAHRPELARLAETLGRHFEAHLWWTASARTNLNDPECATGRDRTKSALSANLGSGPSPAELVAELDRKVSIASNVARQDPASAMPACADDAVSSGLQFTYDSGRSAQQLLPTTMGGGVAILDYDGDGWLDVYTVQGGPFPPRDPSARCADRLFRNLGDGRFEDVSNEAGLSEFQGGYGHGISVGDVDSDGYPDVFITRWNAYALYRNLGDGHFKDVTDAWGLSGDRDWPTSSALADLDGDGDLDLYVCHYLKYDPEAPDASSAAEGRASRQFNPRNFEALPDHVFRNEGDRFVDVTADCGVVDPDGRGLGVLAHDLDGDGLIDLFVANDLSANYLFRNRGGLHFDEVAHEAGVAGNAAGGYQAGMGVACGDLDGDGLPDLAVTNFYGESTTYYHNLGSGFFADHTAAVGLAAPSRFLLGFGAAFFDANNDGWLDLATTNGHVNDARPTVPFAMPCQLLIGGPDGRLRDVSRIAGEPWSVPRVGRGLATGDLDRDGRPDLLVLAEDSPLAYFHNRTEPRGHCVRFRLIGTASGRDAVGTRVTIDTGRERRVSWRLGGGSYQSASDGSLHFGLKDAGNLKMVEVRWPSGRIARFTDLPADRDYSLREGDAQPWIVADPQPAR